MLKAHIAGIEYYLPEKILGNAELAGLFPEWPAEQIEAKTGIQYRHIAAEDETSSDMAVKAARKLFAHGKCAPDEIDFVILCTESPDYFLPPSSCIIQERLGIPTSAGAFDYNLACSGYVYGLAVARGLVETGAARNVLLLTAETYSKFIHPMDKSTRTLFGDAAAATIIRGVESASPSTPFIGPFVFGTDGSGAGNLMVKTGGMRYPRPEATGQFVQNPAPDTRHSVFMDGPAIFSFTLRAVPAAVKTLLAKSEVELKDIDLFVFHQANKFMLDALRRQLKIEPARFFLGLADRGNTVSNTIPIALADAQQKGMLVANQKGNRSRVGSCRGCG